jgi:hypothetical protein
MLVVGIGRDGRALYIAFIVTKTHQAHHIFRQNHENSWLAEVDRIAKISPEV